MTNQDHKTPGGGGASFKTEDALSIDFRTKLLNLLEPELPIESREGAGGGWASNAADIVLK